jgi:hypothetical protein
MEIVLRGRLGKSLACFLFGYLPPQFKEKMCTVVGRIVKFQFAIYRNRGSMYHNSRTHLDKWAPS